MINNPPALIVGLIIGFYWARVLRLVVKMRRTAGASAHFRPPERLGRVLRILWIPTVSLWITIPLVSGILRHPPAPLRPVAELPGAIGWIALAVAVAAMAGTLVCWKRMGKSWRMGIDPQEKTRLVVSGPYGYVRHPIYALSSVLMLATMAVAPSPLMLGVGIVHLLLLQWEARREERHLVRQHGEMYVEYSRNVGRFMPRGFNPYRVAS